MITFIWVLAGLILVGAAFFVAYSSNQRKRAGQASASEVNAEQDGGGSPKIGRATGVN